MKIINLTQHDLTPSQVESGCIEAPDKKRLQEVLTFNTLPTVDEVESRAKTLATMASGYSRALIGGAPFLMSSLEKALLKKGIIPMYSFSQRVSTETTNSEGIVVKTQQFQHIGFVEVKNESCKIN